MIKCPIVLGSSGTFWQYKYNLVPPFINSITIVEKMKLSVSAYRAHASAHKKILDTAYQLNYGSTSASHHASSHTGTTFQLDPPSLDGSGGVGGQHPPGAGGGGGVAGGGGGGAGGGGSSDDGRTPLQSPRSQNTSREEEDESSNANESDCKSPSQKGVDSVEVAEEPSKLAATQSWKNLRAVMAYYHSLRKIKRTKSNQRWMKLRTTVQISSAIQSKKPPLKREDSFLQRFATRQIIPEAQETVEDTGSEGGPGGGAGGSDGDAQAAAASAARRRRRRKAQCNRRRTVVNPDENFYFHWLLVITVSVLYNMWTLIVRQSFPELQLMMSTFWLLCDSCSDVCFLADVAVQLRTGYLEQGLMVYDCKKLARHYLSSRAFLFDLAALCPLDLLQMKLGPQPLLRFPRFLKVYRAVNYYYMVESRTVYPNLWRVVNLIHILLILAHWFGCFYFLLSQAEGFQGDWVYPYRPGDYATLTRKYLGSLYWSTLTLTTIGDLPTPETNAENINSVDGPRSLPRRGVKSRLLQFNTSGGYVFTIVSYLIGVFIFATIVGQVGNVITNRNANRLEFERLLDGAKTYMRHHKVPGGMKRRVLRWYDYSWSRGRIQGGGDINTALGLLPDKLKTELALHVNLTVLKKVTIFQECQPEFLRDLVLKMKAYIFTPGDSICRKGEVAREMFIIADGILEVISEAGKVLTTMKAGDFFGEIGILNLDGLNKRTADVRSVGYSELFSLSREDVLNAMKDYPEAQDILQALGRKRLMEVKASARQHAKEQKERSDNKGLVDKIKNEAKGLRNALRKTRTQHHRRSQESLEMQPLHTSGTSSSLIGKGMLRRMPRVRSHDLSQEETPDNAAIITVAVEEKVPSPLGAGLPLLSRLRLLKEKQENEERLNNCTTPSIVSPAPSSTVRSPPPILEIPHSTSSEPEVIGSGLPLMQRLLLLKAKEERLSASQPTSPIPITQQNNTSSTLNTARTSFSIPTARSSISSTASSNKSSLSVAPVVKSTGKVTFRERLSKLHPGKDASAKVEAIVVPSERKLSAPAPKEVISAPKDILTKDSASVAVKDLSASIDASAVPKELKVIETVPSRIRTELSSVPSAKELDSDLDSNNTSEPSDKILPSQSSLDPEAPWLRLKKAALIQSDIAQKDMASEESSRIVKPSDSSSAAVSSSTGKQPRPKPNLVLSGTGRNKQYRSIDDLSPEYGGLPFVKKLKILNERQKLEELETVMQTRSFSLDIPPDAVQEAESLTRSQSEGCAMHQERLKKQDHNFLTTQLSASPLHSSTESNETLERRQLRSILKKLSEETTPASTITSTIDCLEFRRLMRAPTIEGYAARHSKLAKSVTFNRDTLQSPPNSGHIGTTPGVENLFTFPTGNGFDDVRQQERKGEEEDGRRGDGAQLISSNQKKIKGSLDEDQQYFADILFAIKQVMSSHLQDIQDKYQIRCEQLETRLRERNETIDELRAHISELENAAAVDDSFTDSMETVVSGPDHSWDSTNRYESHEIDDLPHQTLTPQPLWQSASIDDEGEDEDDDYEQITGRRELLRSASALRPSSGVSSATCCILDMDSNTDTDDISDEATIPLSVQPTSRLTLPPISSSSQLIGNDGDDDDDDEDADTSAGEEYENSSSNWEVEMLAAQLRQQRIRSASLDTTGVGLGGVGGGGNRPRRRFIRGSSYDQQQLQQQPRRGE